MNVSDTFHSANSFIRLCFNAGFCLTSCAGVLVKLYALLPLLRVLFVQERMNLEAHLVDRCVFSAFGVRAGHILCVSSLPSTFDITSMKVFFSLHDL